MENFEMLKLDYELWDEQVLQALEEGCENNIYVLFYHVCIC